MAKKTAKIDKIDELLEGIQNFSRTGSPLRNLEERINFMWTDIQILVEAIKELKK